MALLGLKRGVEYQARYYGSIIHMPVRCVSAHTETAIVAFKDGATMVLTRASKVRLERDVLVLNVK